MGYLQSISTIFNRGIGSVARASIIGVFVFLNFSLAAQEKKLKKAYTRVAFGPVLSFYQNNPFHTIDSHPRYAFFGDITEEIRIHKDLTFIPGVEYAYHGLTFNSYYLAPGYQYLYDGHFDYNYRLSIQEARLNIGVKQDIGMENRNSITGYTACTYVLRYLINAKLNVTSNLTGAEMFNGKTDLQFEHPLFTRNTASAVKFITGVQRNFFNTHRALFFELAFTFSLSRFQVSESFTPSNLKINGSFLQIGLGGKF